MLDSSGAVMSGASRTRRRSAARGALPAAVRRLPVGAAAGGAAPAGWRGWRYPAVAPRDLRLDVLRGFFGLVMVIDHLGGASFLYPITGGNRFLVSAAEGFIFLSGLLVGLVFGPRILRDGLATVQMHLLRRALTLYGMTLGLTFTFVGLSRLAGMPWLPDAEPLTPELVVSLVTLHRTYYLVDVMLFYTLMLAVAPMAVLLLHASRTRVVLLLSVGTWLLYQRFPGSAEVPWPIVNNDTFRVAAWQLWFFGGMVIGYHRDRVWERLSRLPRRSAIGGLGLLAGGLLVVHLTDGAPIAGLVDPPSGKAAIELLFDKHAARPGRVLAFAVFFPLFYLALTYFWRPLERAVGWLLLPFGLNALYVYAMHLFAVYLDALLLPHVPGFDRFVAWQNTLAQIATVAAIWLMVRRRVLFGLIPR